MAEKIISKDITGKAACVLSITAVKQNQKHEQVNPNYIFKL